MLALPACLSLMMLASTGVLAQAPHALAYDAFGLAAFDLGVMAPPESNAAEVPVTLMQGNASLGGCRVTVKDGRLKMYDSPDTCPALWGMAELRDLVVVFGDKRAVQLKPRAANPGGPLRFDPATRKISGFTPGTDVAFRANSARWVVKHAPAEVLELSPEEAQSLDPGDFVVYLRNGGQLSRAKVARYLVAANDAEAKSEPTAGDRVLPAGARAPGATQPDEGFACPPADVRHEKRVIVCVDAVDGRLEYTIYPKGRSVVKPNRQFLVVVRHRDTHKPLIKIGGTAGTYVPGMAPTAMRVRKDKSSMNYAESDAAPIRVIETRRLFAPRLPGKADVNVTLVDARNPGVVVDSTTVEFLVETTYSGAFRVGVGAVFLGGIDAKYQRAKYHDSQQHEIAASEKPALDIDLMVGYAPYFDSGGRAKTGCEIKPWCFAPYFGIGLLSQAPSGAIEFFKSLHVGAEWEPIPNFSIAVTAVLRRVERLRQGFSVGSPLGAEEAVPTDKKWAFGIGVVINLTPNFLKLAAGGSSSVLGP